MNVVDICPVGAMTSKDFRFKMRVWFLKSTPTIDVNCGTGTNINIWTREQQVYRITPRQNDEVNSCWMPDSHRLNYKYINAAERIKTPLVKTDAGAPQRPSTWDATINMVVEQLHSCAPAETAIIASARMTNEELYMARALARQLGVTKFDIVPRKGENDGMLISDDRNPNSNGAKLILGKTGAGLQTIRRGVKNHSIRFLIALGEDVTADAGIPEEDLDTLDYLLAMDHTENATTKKADVVLPGVTFAEKYGTMINVTGRIQRLNKAIEPIGESRPDWDILRQLTEQLGCDCPRVIACPSPMIILEEMAQEFEPMKGLTWGNIGNEGKVILETGVTIPLIEREKSKK